MSDRVVGLLGGCTRPDGVHRNHTKRIDGEWLQLVDGVLGSVGQRGNAVLVPVAVFADSENLNKSVKL